MSKPLVAQRLRERLASFDWKRIAAELSERGHARLPRLLAAGDCADLRALYPQRQRFRSFIDLGARGYGDRGDYRYFGYPLPARVRTLRTQLYARLAPIANQWQEALESEVRYPLRLAEYTRHCHDAGQMRPTPLLLRYDRDGYNCLHQDVYGALAFPLQVVILLSEPGREFSGGELLLTEQRPRAQSRGEALTLARGEAVVFPNALRPAQGRRGRYRVQVRHGVSRVLEGERYTLGLIFHDAA